MPKETLKLDDVIALGGGKEDYDMLKDLEKETRKTEVEDFNDGEFKNLINELGFKQISKPERLKGKKSKTRIKKKSPIQDNAISSTTALALSTATVSSGKSPNSTQISSDVPYFNSLPSQLMLKPSSLWHETFAHDSAGQVAVNESYVGSLHAQANKLLENEIKLYRDRHNVSSGSNKDERNAEWMQTVASAGTLSDRVAALSLMVQEAPIHKFHSLEQLLAMAKKKGRREAIMGIEAIRDLMLGDLLPDNRRLKYFHQHPLDLLLLSIKASDGSGEWSVESSQRRLILWAYEHRLKELTLSFVNYLKTFAHDSLEVSKCKAMSVALELLTKKPEQEKVLLTLLANKLGDPKYKIASKALHMLNCVVAQHPLMQGIIVQEVRDLLLRPNLAARAQYYCVCFLSSQILSHERREVAQKLVQIYMKFFKACVEKKKNADNKMLSALLTGVNRAFPYASVTDDEIVGELDILFRTIHLSNLNTAVQSLVLLFQVFSSRNEISDRFYNALYAALFHSELPICTSRHPMLLNVLFRALKADPCDPRVQAFLKRLLQITTLQLPPFSAAVLTLLSELIAVKPSLTCSLMGSTKKTENLKNEESTQNELENPGWLQDEDDDEHFLDVKEDSDAPESSPTEVEQQVSSWTHKHRDAMRHVNSAYDPLHRNPQYCGAEKCAVWELHSMIRHFHPTVALYSKDLISQQLNRDASSGDPLNDHTLIKFLDRFVYRNPKDQTKKNQPIPVMSIHRRRRHASFQNAIPVNSVEFLKKSELSPEEVFFHRYFTSQAGIRPRHTKEGENDESDVESISDDEFEQFMMSAEGQKQIDQQLNFSNHVYKTKTKKGSFSGDEDIDEDESDLASENDDDIQGGYGFDLEDGEEDFLGDGGVFLDENTGSSKKRPSDTRKGLSDPKKRKKEMDDFSLMLEENVTDKVDSTSSHAVSNKDRASAKQLKWENKRDLRDILAKKKSWKQGHIPKSKSGRINKKSFKRKEGNSAKHSKKLKKSGRKR
ncbi:unnamed protein product [Clavelina lepadiformis]|uniref:CCAAT-binding factor domain-containing protein n=1 Tax=Clavelina lepadiformis TaxID=159417 RepID=A0ABP0FMA0_CLALP